MRKILLTSLLFLLTFAKAQDRTIEVQSENQDRIYNSSEVDIKPEYPGGVAAYYRLMMLNYTPPNIKGLKGRVIGSFVIERDGSISDIKILRDLGYGTGEEAIRVLKLCEKWKPAELNGIKVRCIYTFPISIEVN